MTKIRITCVAALAAALLAALGTRTARPTEAASPTFSKDVAPILYKHCASCHRPGDIAPMSLLTYEQARPWAKAIREQVASGQMPPWHAEAAHGMFSNDRRLSEQEKAALLGWVNAGAPKGDEKDLPPAPKFNEGWEIGAPDAVITIPKEYEVPAKGAIDYQYFQAPTNFTEDKWVQAIEARPGARRVVHHILVFCREPGATKRHSVFTQVEPDFRAAARPQAQSDAPGREQESKHGALIATTAPGTNAMIFPPGAALRIKAGSVLTFQMHYTANGEATKDQSSVGLIFAKQPPKHEVRVSDFFNPTFVIPPGANNHSVETAIQFNQDVSIYALFPHTHLRGKSWEYRLVYPDGRKEVVLSVPKYDFNWQTYYVYAKPLVAPKGARLEATARYDNSAANPWNPDPKITVRWGEQTWEEMQYSGISYVVQGERP